MPQYLWLCDINHLKREELKENQTERGRQGGREEEREGEREKGGRGKTCILMSCTFPHHRYKVNTLFPLSYNSVPK